MPIIFRAVNGMCPTYKDYYIYERFSGKDVHGHDTYEYALFKRSKKKLLGKFRRRKQAYEFLGNIIDSRDKIYIQILEESGNAVNEREHLSIRRGDLIYRLEKRTNEVSVRPYYNQQISGWYMTYRECLKEAKEIIGRIESNDN